MKKDLAKSVERFFDAVLFAQNGKSIRIRVNPKGRVLEQPKTIEYLGFKCPKCGRNAGPEQAEIFIEGLKPREGMLKETGEMFVFWNTLIQCKCGQWFIVDDADIYS